MPLLTVEGRYKNGKIDLSESPSGLAEARVLVTFLPEAAENLGPHLMRFGELRGSQNFLSGEDDLKIAEWRSAPGELE